MGVPIVRIVVFWGSTLGSPNFAKLSNSLMQKKYLRGGSNGQGSTLEMEGKQYKPPHTIRSQIYRDPYLSTQGKIAKSLTPCLEKAVGSSPLLTSRDAVRGTFSVTARIHRIIKNCKGRVLNLIMCCTLRQDEETPVVATAWKNWQFFCQLLLMPTAQEVNTMRYTTAKHWPHQGGQCFVRMTHSILLEISAVGHPIFTLTNRAERITFVRKLTSH